MSDVEVRRMPFEGNNPGPSTHRESESSSPSIADSSDILKMLSDPNNMFAALEGPKTPLERYLAAGLEEAAASGFPGDPSGLPFGDLSAFGALRNTSKTLKCPKCNWHYKYQETLEIHMKEKHAECDVKCTYCVENRPHPKLARGETYSCGYKPYRCEICKYSTTTKGNLSIHMQSDKHLHAMQELPNNIANFPCAPMSRCSPIQENDANYLCLVCGFFATDSLKEIVEHAEKDRSRPAQGDILLNNGSYHCRLCPYNTTLKANFQLHTRTDKHLQKVQAAKVSDVRERKSFCGRQVQLPFYLSKRQCLNNNTGPIVGDGATKDGKQNNRA
ncbi:unnamed protein product [Caenorhabditis auriculariae]|uniref:C2H2-type domain-containing protein n=1 Tax=Caenorhabditis auriculariae TaxID=2777116 RepID=A0A8S1GP22_9PELO|nr:unnamed protein product [Caenorhabditis auriculariae]